MGTLPWDVAITKNGTLKPIRVKHMVGFTDIHHIQYEINLKKIFGKTIGNNDFFVV